MNRQARFLSSQSFLGRMFSQHFSDLHCQKPRCSALDHGLSRRKFVERAAGATALALTSNLWTPELARAGSPSSALPKPIPGGVSPFGIFIHHFPVLPAGMPLQGLSDPSQISDFKGFVGLNRVRGAGAGTGFASPLSFQADMGFMKGVFIGEDGEQHHAAFAFI